MAEGINKVHEHNLDSSPNKLAEGQTLFKSSSTYILWWCQRLDSLYAAQTIIARCSLLYESR